MKHTYLLIACAFLLASCNSGSVVTSLPNQLQPVQGKPIPNFSWVQEPLALWQQQSLYNFNYWVTYDPIQLGAYTRQTYAGNNSFDVETFSESYFGWRADSTSALIYSNTNHVWNELSPSFTATEGPVGSSGIKTVHVTDETGTRYYSLQERDMSGQPIAQGVAGGFGDGRRLPDVIANNTAIFSPGAKAYNWVMDQINPEFFIDRNHIVFSNQYELHPLMTCDTISSYCSAVATSINDAITKNAWILNGGRNVSIRLLGNGKAEVRYTGKDGTATPNIYQINYSYIQSTDGTPERLVFNDLSSSDAALTAAVTSSLAVGDGKLAVYTYSGQAVRGTFMAAQTGIQSRFYQYNKQAINDIFTKWDPAVSPVIQ